MKLIEYVRFYVKEIAVFVFMTAIFCIVMILYGIPLRGVAYPTVLALSVAGFFVLAGALGGGRLRERKVLYARIEKLEDERVRLENDLVFRMNDMVEYYSTWAHQIKTPIASMRLELQDLDSESSRRLGQELGRIEQYVDMVMAYARLDSDSTDLVLKEYSVDEIVRPCIRRFAGSFIGKKLKLDYEAPDFTVLTDEKWLSWVIEQVLSNAIKYTPAGGIHIYMEGTSLCISDTGIGIAPEDIPRVWEKGYTGRNGRIDHRASGIGLHLCKRIMDMLGHEISIESEVRTGTTVRIGLETRRLEVE